MLLRIARFRAAVPLHTAMILVFLPYVVQAQEWSSPMVVSDDGAFRARIAESAELATDGQGGWVAVWAARGTIFDRSDVDSDIYSSRSTDDGNTWTAPVTVNPNASSDFAYDQSPHIATDGGGTWVTLWSADDPAGVSRDLYYSRSIDGGLTCEHHCLSSEDQKVIGCEIPSGKVGSVG